MERLLLAGFALTALAATIDYPRYERVQPDRGNERHDLRGGGTREQPIGRQV